MLRSLTLLCVLACLFAGCVSRYDITQFNGNVIRAKGKPRLDKERGVYVFTDLSGQKSAVTASRVRLIEPVRRGSSQKTFNSFEGFK